MLALQQRWWQGADATRLLSLLRQARALLDDPAGCPCGGTISGRKAYRHPTILECAAAHLAGVEWYEQRRLTHAAFDVLNHCYRNGYWSAVEYPAYLEGSQPLGQLRKVYDAAIATCLAQHTLNAVTPPSSPQDWSREDGALDWSVLHQTERSGKVGQWPNAPCTRCGGTWRYHVGSYLHGAVRRCLHCGATRAHR